MAQIEAQLGHAPPELQLVPPLKRAGGQLVFESLPPESPEDYTAAISLQILRTLDSILATEGTFDYVAPVIERYIAQETDKLKALFASHNPDLVWRAEVNLLQLAALETLVTGRADPHIAFLHRPKVPIQLGYIAMLAGHSQGILKYNDPHNYNWFDEDKTTNASPQASKNVPFTTYVLPVAQFPHITYHILAKLAGSILDNQVQQEIIDQYIQVVTRKTGDPVAVRLGLLEVIYHLLQPKPHYDATLFAMQMWLQHGIAQALHAEQPFPLENGSVMFVQGHQIAIRLLDAFGPSHTAIESRNWGTIHLQTDTNTFADEAHAIGATRLEKLLLQLRSNLAVASETLRLYTPEQSAMAYFNVRGNTTMVRKLRNCVVDASLRRMLAPNNTHLDIHDAAFDSLLRSLATIFRTDAHLPKDIRALLQQASSSLTSMSVYIPVHKRNAFLQSPASKYLYSLAVNVEEIRSFAQSLERNRGTAAFYMAELVLRQVIAEWVQAVSGTMPLELELGASIGQPTQIVKLSGLVPELHLRVGWLLGSIHQSSVFDMSMLPASVRHQIERAQRQALQRIQFANDPEILQTILEAKARRLGLEVPFYTLFDANTPSVTQDVLGIPTMQYIPDTPSVQSDAAFLDSLLTEGLSDTNRQEDEVVPEPANTPSAPARIETPGATIQEANGLVIRGFGDETAEATHTFAKVWHIPFQEKLGDITGFVPQSFSVYDDADRVSRLSQFVPMATNSVTHVSGIADIHYEPHDADLTLSYHNPKSVVFGVDGYMPHRVYVVGNAQPLQHDLGMIAFAAGAEPTAVVVVSRGVKSLWETARQRTMNVGTQSELAYMPIWHDAEVEQMLTAIVADRHLSGIIRNTWQQLENVQKQQYADNDRLQAYAAIQKAYILQLEEYVHAKRFYALDTDVPVGRTRFPVLEFLGSHPKTGYFCQISGNMVADAVRLFGMVPVVRNGHDSYTQDGELRSKISHCVPYVVLSNGEILRPDLVPETKLFRTPLKDILTMNRLLKGKPVSAEAGIAPMWQRVQQWGSRMLVKHVEQGMAAVSAITREARQYMPLPELENEVYEWLEAIVFDIATSPDYATEAAIRRRLEGAFVPFSYQRAVEDLAILRAIRDVNMGPERGYNPEETTRRMQIVQNVLLSPQFTAVKQTSVAIERALLELETMATYTV